MVLTGAEIDAIAHEELGEFDDDVYRDFDLFVIRGDVFGVVRFTDGKALGNVRVQLSHRADTNYALETLTAVDGTFRFTVPIDVYMINVLSPPPVPGWTAGPQTRANFRFSSAYSSLPESEPSASEMAPPEFAV